MFPCGTHGIRAERVQCAVRRLSAAPGPCRLLESYVAEARKHGVRPHQVTLWVRRKLGAHISVWRKRSDGTFGCATPCVLCQRELKRYDLRVHCSQDSGWFVGRLSEAGAPAPQLTTAQRRLFSIGSHQILEERLRKFAERFGLAADADGGTCPARTEGSPPHKRGGPAPAADAALPRACHNRRGRPTPEEVHRAFVLGTACQRKAAGDAGAAAPGPAAPRTPRDHIPPVARRGQ